jgi:hypothetical protein
MSGSAGAGLYGTRLGEVVESGFQTMVEQQGEVFYMTLYPYQGDRTTLAYHHGMGFRFQIFH